MISIIFNAILQESQPKKDQDQEVLLMEQTTKTYHLVIFNDDFNTFDYVIECLIEICEHEQVQAEQCTHIIHFKGKCSVKIGELEDLLKMNNELLSRGLSSKVIENIL